MGNSIIQFSILQLAYFGTYAEYCIGTIVPKSYKLLKLASGRIGFNNFLCVSLKKTNLYNLVIANDETTVYYFISSIWGVIDCKIGSLKINSCDLTSY